jgi:co-chaperonin GroES (HSP10)
VVCVGSGVDEADLKAGSRVFYNWIHGREVQVDGQSLRLLETEEILGVEHES